MESLPVHVFKDSFGPFLALLNENQVRYRMREQRAGVPMASGGVIEVLQSAAMWGGLASVIIAFLKVGHGRKVIITTKDDKVIHAEGLTRKELELILESAKNLTAIETKPSTPNNTYNSEAK
jgi:hypothetical protein